MSEMAILNDEIRNPLSVIIVVADMLNYPDGELIKNQGKIIDSIISTLDPGFLESEKVRSFLQRHARFDNRGEENKK
jgi:methyl-accepting chemotaxis protein